MPDPLYGSCLTYKTMHGYWTGKLGTLDLTFGVLLGPGTPSTATPQTTLPTATFRAAAFTQFTLRSCRERRRTCNTFNTEIPICL